MRKQTQHRRRPSAFTLLELLVVIAVIGVLAGLLVLGLASAKEKGQSIRCVSNLRQIGLAATMYADENGDRFHHVMRKRAEIPDGGKWTAAPWIPQMLPAEDPAAYWGVAYSRYLNASRELFRCPGAKRVDEWPDEFAGIYPSSFWLNSTYGINRHLITPFASDVASPLTTHSLRSPETTILAQDSAEQRMEGPEDSLGLFPGQTEILRQWRFTLRHLYPDREMWLEWYRHQKQCNTLWVAGHVTPIRFNGFDRGVDYRCYTGDTPVVPP